MYSYTITWKRSLDNIDLDGVEYKSLPSGLHSVKEDLVYFIHRDCAGVSCFVQEESDAQHRNASFAAVGVLVPLSYGRLGRSWMRAAALRQLARDVVKDTQDTRALELFWKQHGRESTDASKDATSSPSIPRASLQPESERKRKRAQSDTTAGLAPDSTTTPDHPALCMPELLNTFGPLLFPLYRAALLRKRILILGTPPVQRSCNFVYMLSILSSVPQPLKDVTSLDSEALMRMQPLFSVGIYDIPTLSERTDGTGWVACTTDDILGEKQDLYDMLVSLPPHSSPKANKRWPTLSMSDGATLKASQRDLRRYRLLRAELRRIKSQPHRYRDDPSHHQEDGIAQLTKSTTSILDEVKQADEGENEVAEPVSWTAMAYNGFMWWASAGEMKAWENEEVRSDRELLEDLPDVEDILGSRDRTDRDDDEVDERLREAQVEATMTSAYFHRLTSQVLQVLADVVEEADDDTEEGIAESDIEVSADEIRNVGLDSWVVADKDFVHEAMRVYFGREARMQEASVTVCGVRIC